MFGRGRWIGVAGMGMREVFGGFRGLGFWGMVGGRLGSGLFCLRLVILSPPFCYHRNPIYTSYTKTTDAIHTPVLRILLVSSLRGVRILLCAFLRPARLAIGLGSGLPLLLDIGFSWWGGRRCWSLCLLGGSARRRGGGGLGRVLLPFFEAGSGDCIFGLGEVISLGKAVWGIRSEKCEIGNLRLEMV